ncbi:lipoprotein-releasing ABC transporter permease subunit [Ectothiorhodospiraceae bacterium BW-2]|nr:lipoprotein-releasing ABC transporter permease subunit [Ectothiorhodospiraceae bacterium BW-2]
MFQPYELFIGLRYTRAKRRNHFISFISLTSMLGIALGVTALITVLSVMNGFETELRERILGMTSHATINGFDGPMRHWQPLREQALQHPEVVAAAPYIEKEGMVLFGEQVNGVMLRGILPQLEQTVSVVGERMVDGHYLLQPGEFQTLIGNELAFKLGVSVGDKITVVSPTVNVSIAGVVPRLKRFTVVGLFEIGMYEYDSAMMLLHLDDAKRLFRMGDGVSGVRLKLEDMFRAPLISRDLARTVPGSYWVRDWTQYHANFFRALKTEKRVMFIILLLIVAVAAFNIVSTLVMVVTDKESDIAILRTLGGSPGSVMAIFMVQGVVIGVIGTLVGVIGGVSLALNVETLVPAIERLFGVQFLPADVYYISDLPSELHWKDVGTIASISFLLTVVATLYPAWRAAKTEPAESLRYE